MRVTNGKTTCDFYARVLGMVVITFSNVTLSDKSILRKALRFSNQKNKLHPKESDWYRVKNPHCGGKHISLITETPMSEVIPHFKTCEAKIEQILQKDLG